MLTYPINFKAAILRQAKKPLSLETIRFEGPLKRGQVLVKIIYSGICGKQIDEILQKGGKDKFIPHLLGHEGVGLVLDIGPGVKKVKKNDQVILHWVKGSGINSETPKYLDNKDKFINAGWVTTFNEYSVVSENRMTPVNNATKFKELSLLGCAASTGLSISLKQAKINHKKDNIIIYGCGGVGLFIIQGAKLLKVKKIIAIDNNNNSLKLAKKCGATHLYNSKKKKFQSETKNFILKQKANKVFVTVGNKAVIEDAISLTSTPGETYIIGVPFYNSIIRVNAFDLMHKKNLFGSLGGDFNPDIDISNYIKLNNLKKIFLRKVITKTLKFSEINSAIFQIQNGYSGKIIIKIF
jgi:Zn-dependent alcohol dehydrogenase